MASAEAKLTVEVVGPKGEEIHMGLSAEETQARIDAAAAALEKKLTDEILPRILASKEFKDAVFREVRTATQKIW